MDLKKYERIKTIKDYVVYIVSVIFVWISISSTICAFKNPELTQTQLLLRIPQSFILNFE